MRIFRSALLFFLLAVVTGLSAQESDMTSLGQLLARTAGISPGVAAAAGLTPRTPFVPANREASLYQNRTVPLGEGLFLPSPSDTALFLSELKIRPEDRVLVAGVVTGYTAALVRRLAGQVVVMEQNPAERGRIADYLAGDPLPAGPGYAPVTLIRSWDPALLAAEEPFQVIIVHGAAVTLPAVLMNLLARPGRLGAVLRSDAGFSLAVYLSRDDRGETLRTGTSLYFPALKAW